MTNLNLPSNYNLSPLIKEEIENKDEFLLHPRYEVMHVMESINTRLLSHITSVCEKKKSYVYNFLLNCYDVMSEIEKKIQEEKQSLEMLLYESMQKVKLQLDFEEDSNNIIYSIINNKLEIQNKRISDNDKRKLKSLEVKMENVINDTLLCENFNFLAYQLSNKLNILRNNIFNKLQFNDIKQFVSDDCNFQVSINITTNEPNTNTLPVSSLKGMQAETQTQILSMISSNHRIASTPFEPVNPNKISHTTPAIINNLASSGININDGLITHQNSGITGINSGESSASRILSGISIKSDNNTFISNTDIFLNKGMSNLVKPCNFNHNTPSDLQTSINTNFNIYDDKIINNETNHQEKVKKYIPLEAISILVLY